MKDIIKKVVIGVISIAVILGVAVNAIKGDEPAVDNTTTTVNAPADSTPQGTNGKPSNSDAGVNADATTKPNGNAATQAPNSNDPTQGQQNAPTQAPNSNDPTQGQQNAPTQTPNSNDPTQGQQNAPTQAPNNNDPTQGQQNTPTQAPNSNDPTQGQQNTPTQAPDSNDPTQGQQSDDGTDNPANPVNPQNPGASDTTTNPVVPGKPQYVNKIDVYQNMFKSGKFIMKVNDPELGLVTMAMSGNKMFLEASMEGVTLKMIYDGDKPDEENPETGTWYMVIDKIKKYSPMPADMLGDMNVEELTKDFTKDEATTVYTKSTEVVNGEELYCESCVDENGNTTKYYFRGDQLVRSDSISPSGEISTTEFQEISADVDDSVFAIPEGYAKLNISWLFSMMS